ncbi:MAG: flagellar hook-basal body complex protein [Planctomycetes bacterium]|nr:flagellar hook-basal body complex protein [Planctomycetota bacterium]
MVNTSLYTGLSGLRVHQRYIDVIGNNLANVSTQGFWGSRATFGDMLSVTMRPGSAPTGNFGGQNPMQVGLGADIASIDLNTTQGAFSDTGRPLDVALQGRGFFVLNDGVQNFYTRVGTFGVDRERNLVDARTGYRVVASNGSRITVPVTDTLPATATTSVKFQGNLPATVTGPLEEILASASGFKEGTAATDSTVPGGGGTYNLTAFMGRSLLVSVNGSAQVQVSFPASAFANPAAATAAEIQARFTAANIRGLQITAQPGGQLDFATTKLGSSATLKFDDGPGAAGFLSALGLDARLSSGTETAASLTTSLASLTAREAAYQAGDQILISGTNPDGSAVSDTFIFGTGAGQDGTTLGDMVNFLNATFDSAAVTASLDTTNGTIRLTTTAKGPASLTLTIQDANGNSGNVLWPKFNVSQDGKGPDTATTSIDVVDSLGRTHQITLTFTRTTTNPAWWDLRATMPAAEGTIPQDTISQIRFNTDGSFAVVGGGSTNLLFAFNGLPGTQSIAVDLGTAGAFDGVSMLGNQTTVAAVDQDGFEAGTLLNIAFDTEGRLLGFYSNGRNEEIAQLRIALFPNENGLLRQGDTMFVEAPNSDDAINTTASAAGAGVVRPGSLENSNVDIAQEFVNLIEAQRGFQANSRVITTTDEILAELVNIVR